MRKGFVLIWAIVIGVCQSAIYAEPVTTGSLIEEMIDMNGLTRFPTPAFKTIQFSSYDRSSKVPGGPGWFANSDGFGREPIPNVEAVLKEPNEKKVGEFLLCDVKGPGAIVRTWTAGMNGAIRLYLDGADEPVWQGSANDFLRWTYRTYTEDAGIDDAILQDSFYQRDAAYCPIPFAKRCRIVWTGSLRSLHFYQIQIRMYDADAEVVTFKPSDLKTYKDTITRVARVLADPDQAWPRASKKTPVPIDVLVPAREIGKQIFEIKGSQAIERLELKVEAGNLDLALRQTVMNIIFDDYPWGQVQSPIGDFFGAAPGINPYDSAPFTVRSDGTMICRYVMPFTKSCKIVIDNYGLQTVKITGSVLPVDYEWDKDRSMYFRAKWRVDHELIGSNEAVQDLPYLIATGKGVYVGSAALIMNPNSIPYKRGSWWGEGDEKIYVDDDTFPSTFGTGAEDYYNYSWSLPDIFDFAYCSQPRADGPANRGFVTNNRWHIIDPLPFKQRMAFYMELYSHEETPGISYARIGYHYGRPDLMDDHVPIKKEDVREVELPESWWPVARLGAENSRFYEAGHLLKDEKNIDYESLRLFSGRRLMVWHPQKKGDELDLEFETSETRKYTIRITAAVRPSSGPVSVLIDGKKVGLTNVSKQKVSLMDLYIPYRVLSRTFSTGKLPFTEGKHTLTLRYEGDDPVGNNKDVGIDFIWVQK